MILWTVKFIYDRTELQTLMHQTAADKLKVFKNNSYTWSLYLQQAKSAIQ